ncbi:stage II sporulation protein R [Jeotgalibacillus terrae]|uniref:Stage II sporulation protein R n=1 Tax=Jeotgalibacillus terrae TaxID=587735 RepID=A0ABW5ZBH0_9BACL|nr:stage II sporulation protein R [Jeotgalibacillus terrae]MBM7577961.1 stage II sporulation protein R [Jeotgalibacillus terrae]
MIQKTMILVILLALFTPSAFAADSDIRMRVIANSDTETDQSQKEALFKEIQPALIQLLGHEPLTRRELADRLKENLFEIQQLVDKKAQLLMPEQTVTTTFEPHTFPDGQTYLTLVVTIGKGEGQNWWCTFFPELCGTVTLQEEENDECENDLSPEKTVSKKEVKVESFIVNWISDKWNRFNEKRG